ncbi:uroporphyrinogen-III synthase [Tenuibacillus multivorans]|uniref:Uroporphyrinogen-III synthase n=1 Tax=Tenuibacillus multivorans TaxID=237069 RepID=A0A1G9ZML8_9BACI|nr:uroporphyrinogen-III synthase [Tenuibacillus multivorans]GEL77442.1 uroporphyrinogen-III synthase [Tenuibacillus multivorans]SDN22357.1 uroporphyrinogen-III synthase [Tenuibacillus multivorans]
MSFLLDKHIFLSRDEEKASDFIDLLNEKDAKISALPLIKFESTDLDESQALFNQLRDFDWIVFTSANGVEYFFHHLENHRLSIEPLKQLKMAVVGTKTEQTLQQFGFNADFIPSHFDAEHFSREFTERYHPRHVLMIKGNLSRRVIDEAFDRVGCHYENMYVYRTLTNAEIQKPLNHLVDQQEIDAWVFTSPSSIEAFFKLINHRGASVLGKPCFCIGHTTEIKAKEYRFKHTLVPDVFTLEGLAYKVIEYYARKESKNE